MYERGVLIMYGNSGVCRVEDVAPMKGSRGAEKNRLYYKLSPVLCAQYSAAVKPWI